MYLGMYSFRGDPAELLAGHDRMLALLPEGRLDLHLCVQTEDGIAILDTCPNRGSLTVSAAVGHFRS